MDSPRLYFVVECAAPPDAAVSVKLEENMSNALPLVFKKRIKNFAIFENFCDMLLVEAISTATQDHTLTIVINTKISRFDLQLPPNAQNSVRVYAKLIGPHSDPKVGSLVNVKLELRVRNLPQNAQEVHVSGNCEALGNFHFSDNTKLVDANKTVDIDMVNYGDGSLLPWDCLNDEPLGLKFKIDDDIFPRKNPQQADIIGDFLQLQCFIVTLDWKTKTLSIYKKRNIELKFFVQEKEVSVNRVFLSGNIFNDLELQAYNTQVSKKAWISGRVKRDICFRQKSTVLQGPLTDQLEPFVICLKFFSGDEIKLPNNKPFEIKLSENFSAASNSFLVAIDVSNGSVSVQELPVIEVPVYFLLKVAQNQIDSIGAYVKYCSTPGQTNFGDQESWIELQRNGDLHLSGLFNLQLCFDGRRAYSYNSNEIEKSRFVCQTIQNYGQPTDQVIELQLKTSFKPTATNSATAPAFLVMHELKDDSGNSSLLTLDGELRFHLNYSAEHPSDIQHLTIRFGDAVPYVTLHFPNNKPIPFVALFTQENGKILQVSSRLEVKLGCSTPSKTLRVPRVSGKKKFFVFELNNDVKIQEAQDFECKWALTGFEPRYGDALCVVGSCAELGSGAKLKENEMRYDSSCFRLEKRILACKISPNDDRLLSWHSESTAPTEFWLEKSGFRADEMAAAVKRSKKVILKPGDNQPSWKEIFLQETFRTTIKFCLAIDDTVRVTPTYLKIEQNDRVKLTNFRRNLYVTNFDAVFNENTPNVQVFFKENQPDQVPDLRLPPVQNAKKAGVNEAQTPRLKILASVVYRGENSTCSVAVAHYFNSLNFYFQAFDCPIDLNKKQRLFLCGNCTELERVELQQETGSKFFSCKRTIEMCQIQSRLLAWNPTSNQGLTVRFQLVITDEDNQKRLLETPTWKLTACISSSPDGKDQEFVVQTEWNCKPAIFPKASVGITFNVECDVTVTDATEKILIKELMIEPNVLLKRITARKDHSGRTFDHWKATTTEMEQPLIFSRISGSYTQGSQQGERNNFVIPIRVEEPLYFAPNAREHIVKAKVVENFSRAEIRVASMLPVTLYIVCCSDKNCEQVNFTLNGKATEMRRCFKNSDIFLGEKKLEMYNYAGKLLLENGKPLKIKFKRKLKNQQTEEAEKNDRTLELECKAAANEVCCWYNANFNQPHSQDSIASVKKVTVKIDSNCLDWSSPEKIPNLTNIHRIAQVRKKKPNVFKIRMYINRGELYLPGEQRLKAKFDPSDNEWHEIQLFDKELEGKLHFNVVLFPKGMHLVFPNMSMIHLPRDSVLSALQSALHSGLPNLPDEMKKFEHVRDTLAKYLVPAIKENGDYVENHPANRPHEFHNIWGEDPDSDKEDENLELRPIPRSPLKYVRLKYRRYPRSARNFAYEALDRLNVVYHSREAQVFEHLNDCARGCCRAVHQKYEYHGKDLCEFDQPVTHDTYIGVLTEVARNLTEANCQCEIKPKFVMQDSAAIVRGRLEAFLVGKKDRKMFSEKSYGEWRRHAEAASSWFVLLVAVWHRCRGQVDGQEIKFEDAIKEDVPMHIPMFYRWKDDKDMKKILSRACDLIETFTTVCLM